MLMHQGIGLDAFNTMRQRRAVHAVYECCGCVSLAVELARARPYADHDALFRQSDALLFSMTEASVDAIVASYPSIGRRPRSTRSRFEPCAVWDARPEVMERLDDSARRYERHFGFNFVIYVNGFGAAEVLAAITDRLHNDGDTERKVVRNELARLNRRRLERMLGPEGGYHNW